MSESKSVQGNGAVSGTGGLTGFFKVYVVEPALFLHMLTATFVFMVLQDLIADKACRVDLGYSEDVCEALSTKSSGAIKYDAEEKEVQKLLGAVLMWRSMLENLFPIFLVILIGSWSDKYGRKPPMLFVILGFAVQNIGLVLCVYFGSSVGAYTVALVSSIIPGLTGHNPSLCMAAFSYLSDTTPVDRISVRTGIAHSVLFLGNTVGLGLGGFLATNGLGFTNIFAIGFGLELLAFLYILFGMKNVVQDQDAVKGKSVGDMAKDLFSTKHLKEAFSVVVKERPGNTRLKLMLLLITHFCIMTPAVGEMGVLFLFGRYALSWDSADFGAFMTYKMVVGFIGNFLSVGLLTQTLKLSDPAVGVCASLSVIVSSVLLAGANSSLMMYLITVISILGPVNAIVPRTALAKFIPSTELGKVNSFLACLESISPIAAAPLYTMFYTHTFEAFPGAFNLLTAGLLVPPIMVYGWFISQEREEAKKTE